PEGQNVDTKESSPILSESNMPSSPYSQKVGILLKDGFSSKELTDTMKFLTEKGVFIEVISDKLGILKGDDETEIRSEEHTSELQSRFDLVCRLLLEKRNE